MENSSNSCLTTVEIVGSPFFAILLSLEAVVGLLSVLPNLILAYVVLRAGIYPLNLRCLLSHLSLNIAWASVANSVKVIGMLGKRPCDLSMSAWHCRMIDLPMTIPQGNIIYSLVGLCLERTYCSIRYRTYEKESSRLWLATLFLSLIWTGSLAANLMSLPSIPAEKMVPICDSVLAIGMADAGKALSSNMVLEFIALLTILFVSCWDRRKFFHSALNRAKFTLTERFQLSQCVHVHKMLVPSIILHGICFLPYMIILLLVANGIDMAMKLKWILFHSAYLYRLLYSLIHPLLSFARNAHLRQQFVKSMPPWLQALKDRLMSRTDKLSPSGQQSPQNAHFNVLEGYWAKPSERGGAIAAANNAKRHVAREPNCNVT